MQHQQAQPRGPQTKRPTDGSGRCVNKEEFKIAFCVAGMWEFSELHWMSGISAVDAIFGLGNTTSILST